MEDLRLALLKDTNPKKIKDLINRLKYEDIYYEFCDFFDKCEVLRIEIADSVRKFIVDFIMEYRRENSPSTGGHVELSIQGRVNLVRDILEENLIAFDDISDDEKIHLLKFLARIMNVLRFNGQSQRQVPWMEFRFLVCIYVANQTDKRHTKYPLIDCFFQFLVDEELIVNSLKKLSKILKNELWNEKWTDLKTIYKIVRYYYEMRKIHFHIVQIQPTDFDMYLENEMILIRHFQQIGESLKVIEKLGISKEKTKEVPFFELFFSEKIINSFISMRNTLSHAKTKKGVIANFPFVIDLQISLVKMYIIILDLLNEEQISIMDIYIRKLLTETDSMKFLSKIHRIKTQEINNWEYKQNDNVITKWFADYITNTIESALKCDGCQSIPELDQLPRALDNLKTLNSGKFSSLIVTYFKNLRDREDEEIQSRLEYLLQNKARFRSEQISNLFSVIRILNSFFLTMPEMDEKYNLLKILQSLIFNQTRVIEQVINKSDDYKIETILEIISNSIDNLEDQREFEELRNNLILKRQIYKDYKLFKDPNYIRTKWPKYDETVGWINDEATYEDPLQSIVLKTKTNLPDSKTVKQFLDKINLGKRGEIVERAKYLESIKLKNRLLTIERELSENKDNQFGKEMAVLERFEILRLLDGELVEEPNYMDHHCLLPSGRPLRNYLAHGDIYLDLFLTQIDRQTILENQLKEVYGHKRSTTVPRKEDLSYIKDRFNKQKSWIKTFIAPLKLNIEDRYISRNNKTNFAMVMRVRDIQGWTFMHHNLRKCDRNNKFLMYLLDKMTRKGDRNEIYDEMIEESKNCKGKYILQSDPVKLGCSYIDYLIDALINESNHEEKRLLLCKVLSINCPEIDLFQHLCQGLEQHIGHFLLLACLNKNIEIVKYIIEMGCIKEKSVFENCVEIAVMVGSLQLVRYLIAKDANIIGSNSLTIALCRGDLELIKLLLEHGPEPDFSIILKHSLYLFCNPNICEYFVNEYPNFINFNNCQLLFESCVFRNERLVKFLVEKGANFNAILNEKSVLMIASHYFDDVEVVKYLVDKGAKIESDTVPNALILACQNSRVKIAKFLLDNGANPSLEYGDESALNWAIKNQSYKITEELFKRKVKINESTVGEFIRNIKPVFFKYLIGKDSNINWMFNSLDCVIAGENVELLNEMLKHLIKFEHPLSYVSFKHSLKSKDLFYLLLEYPYNKLSDLDWSNLLFDALYFLEIDEMKIIISKGADIKHKTAEGVTIWDIFFYYNVFDKSKLRFLLHSGADITAKNRDLTPTQIAARRLDIYSYQDFLRIVLEFLGS